MEDSIFIWVLDHIPTTGIMLIACWLTWKIRDVFTNHRDRLVKVEGDTSDLKKDVKSIKKKVSRMDRKFDKKFDNLDRKFDRLINYLITTKQVKKKALR